MNKDELNFPPLDKKYENPITYYGNDHKKVIYDGTIIALKNEPVYIGLTVFDTSWIVIKFEDDIEPENNESKIKTTWKIEDNNLLITFSNFKSPTETVQKNKASIAKLNNEDIGMVASIINNNDIFICKIIFFLGGKYE